MNKSRRLINRRRVRLGTAAVELAVCLPLLTLVVFGSIETCLWIHAHESLHVAAYEAARAAVKQEAQPADVIRTAQELLACRNFDESRVQITPGNFSNLQAGSVIRVRVEMPIHGENSWIPAFARPRDISVTAVFVKE